jgi:Holliday junction resolvasome RuvABC DNA-binding subunit
MATRVAPPAPGPDRANALVADRLREAAELLEQQQANPFRVRAYREAADTVEALDEDIAALASREGAHGLMALPAIGPGIAAAIEEILHTGRWSQLERLRGTLDPERLFRAVPGVGPALARRIHDSLHVDTLEALEMAAHDGRLAAVAGIGPRRAAVIRSALGTMLGRRRPRLAREGEEPSVALLLDVDRAYREAAAAGRLSTIAPRRFNPSGEAWLPVLHTEREPWHFTVMFSNTARAHELGRTRDWVVMYFHTDRHAEGQRTVVTETRGALAGRRVVRGREVECLAMEEAHAAINRPGGSR